MLIYVPLSQIDDNPFQARQDYGDVAELAGRIAAARANYPDSYGLMQIPRGRVIFRNATEPDGKVYSVAKALTLTDKNRVLFIDPAVRVQLAFGHRRLRAFRHLWETQEIGYERGILPVHIGELTDEQMLDAVWSENRERKDISAVEEAELLARKLERAGSQREVAEAWGVDRSTVANRLRLLDLPPDIQQANREGKLSERACLALAPVVEIQQAVNGQVKWGKRQEHWGPPIAPAAFIERAINDPKMTSDAIRDYTKQALQHAGAELPKVVADWPAKDVSGIQQVTCKGCPKRINNTCVLTDCLKRKKEAFQDVIIAEAEATLGIPFSDRQEDFDFSYAERVILKALWDSGGQRAGTSFVLGWQPSGYGLRPFSKADANEYLSNGDTWKDDGRGAIAIGHRGTLPQHLLPAEQAAQLKPAADIPDQATRNAWTKEVKKLLAAADKAARRAMVDKLYLPLDALGDVAQAFVTKNDAVWLDEHEKVVALFVDFMWKNSPAAPTYYSDWRDMEHLRQFLYRAGLNPAAVLTLGQRDDLRRDALLALSFWYDRREYGTWAWLECQTALTAVLTAFTAAQVNEHDEELFGLQYELLRAQRDLAGKMAEEKAQQEARDRAKAQKETAA